MPEKKVLECSFAFTKELTDAGQFEGHAAIFNFLDLQNDKIRKGAFRETIEESAGRWPVLMGHNTGRVVGFSTGAEEDSKGLKVWGEFTLASDEGRNAYATARHASTLGQKIGLSIGYSIRGEDGADYDEKTGIRTLRNLNVWEFSLAAIPAQPRARMTAVKSLDDCATVRDVEQWMREQGATGDQARKLISVCRRERDANADRDGELERDAKAAELTRALGGLREALAIKRTQDFYHQTKGTFTWLNPTEC